MKISELQALGAISDAANTFLAGVVTSDTTQSPSGSNYRVSVSDITQAAGGSNLVFVAEKNDLPAAVGGVITLAENRTYYFTDSVDLTGDRLQASANSVIIGTSSEVSKITSTGLGAGVPLLTTAYTLPVRNVTFMDVDTALAIDGAANPPVALDWYGVNFLNVPNVGIIQNIDNFIYINGAFLNSKGLVFDGSVGTAAFDTALFSGDGEAGAIVSVADTATITRRFRAIYSAVIAFGSTTGFNVSASASIPVEGYILDTLNFSGGGTYLAGLNYTSNKSRFNECKGIVNSAVLGNFYMVNNTTPTTIAAAGVPVKAAGATTASVLNQKFTHSDNRLTYNGEIVRNFQASLSASLNSGNNNQIGIYIAKNGVVITESETYVTTDSGGKAQSASIQCLFQLTQGDYVEIWVENETTTTNITLELANLIVKALD